MYEFYLSRTRTTWSVICLNVYCASRTIMHLAQDALPFPAELLYVNRRGVPNVNILLAQTIAVLMFYQRVWWSIWLRKIFQAVLCPTQLFQWKLICTFNQHCLSYKISNRLQCKSSLFPNKLFKMLLHWHTFFQHVPHVENTFKYINTYAHVFCWSV